MQVERLEYSIQLKIRNCTIYLPIYLLLKIKDIKEVAIACLPRSWQSSMYMQNKCHKSILGELWQSREGLQPIRMGV